LARRVSERRRKTAQGARPPSRARPRRKAAVKAQTAGRAARGSFVLRPIGVVRSPFTDREQIPRGPGAKHDEEGVLEIRSELEPGLQDIEGFSHLYVIWAFHMADRSELVAHPPSDDRPHGVFATRSPRRPNPLALTVVELLGRDGPRLRVRGVDMLDGTPILDVKPYLSSVPPEKLRRGWLDEAEARRAKASPGH
jgi:tRNA-Thr(GGU) m(6)t(6)A37 methyltransferase TsaA